ncbi:MAG: ATP-binding cassette domain-containing protein [Calditerrivibrio sp.]|nr:ATP-binding cassette domain-containing protein [Calditerrivibrio sp.]MCA1980047.1 ATP-binding cassette domain-containing protein [Calditerrivibrio sp.]
MEILSAEGITKEYRISDNFFQRSNKLIKALDNVSFSIEKGNCIGIVGESGSGKTTLAKIVSGVLLPEKGVVKFRGESIYKKTDFLEYRKNVQMVFQDPYSSLNPRLKIFTVFSDIIKTHITRDHEVIKKIAVDNLKKVGLDEEHLYRYPHQFSGGQRQRLSIARCLLLDPEVIIADEPVSALDVSLAAQILNLLKNLKREGKTIILIAHDLAIVKFICDEVMVLKNGVIQEYGKKEQIFNSPNSEYTKELIESSLVKESYIRGIGADSSVA